tara:strand:- start:1997 stop:2710 length:714 start_codon:yes stop_codon:yes gene_type:complete
MALPKLNDMPKYSVTIPSSKQEVRIRPFVVKEEKILLIAMESQDPKQIANAILDTIVSCTEEQIDANSLTSYDVEYLFLQIRGKSVGEKSNVILKCMECGHDNEVTIDLGDIKIEGNIPDKKIKITDQISLEMKPPSYLQVADNEKIIGEGQKDVDRVFGLIVASIGAVLTEEERFDFKDYSFEEATEFLESMTSEQFTKVRDYMESQPALRHPVEYDCESCGHKNKINLEGMQDFF